MAISIPWFNRAKITGGRVGLSVGPDGLAVAHINASGEFTYCHFQQQLGDTEQVLSELVAEQGWENAPCSVVLPPVYYQLLLTERPPVEGDELSSAVRWKVKELLDFPLEDAAIEHFLLPEDAYRGRQKMLYVAALRKATLQSLIEPIEASGLRVDCIEVSELALHNLVARIPAEAGGLAVLQLQDGESFINLVEDGAIYLSRRLDIGLANFKAAVDDVVQDNSHFFEALILEVQRSLDYYESQLGKGIITRLLYSPNLEKTAEIGDFLAAQLGLNIAPMDITNQTFIITQVALDNRCACAIGAALGPLDVEADRAAP